MPILTPKGFPVPPGRIKYWGITKHGLCTNGQLALPNGSNIAYTQPVGGHTWIVKNPRRAALPANPRPLAQYDAAQGYSWLTFLILAGENRQLAEQNIGAFNTIWVDDSDRAWLVGLSEIAGGFRLTLKSRFGLFGEDALSGLSDVVLYEGNLGEDITEHLNTSDFCPNWDGTSIMCNFRNAIIQASDVALPNLMRVVELQLSGAVTNTAGAGATFSFRQEVAYLSQVISTSDPYDSGDQNIAACPISIDSRTVNSMQAGSSSCGPGGYEIGVWPFDAQVSAGPNNNSSYRNYGHTNTTIRYIKVFYGHDNQKVTLTLNIRDQQNTVVSYDCSHSLNANYSGVTSVAEEGGGCSALASHTKTSVISATHNVNGTSSSSRVTTTSLQVNGVQLVTFTASRTIVDTYSLSADESGNVTQNWAENETPPADPVADRVSSLISLSVGSPVAAENVNETTTRAEDNTSSFDGQQNGLPGETYNSLFATGSMGIVGYANRIFGFRLGDGTLTVDNHAYMGVYGLVADTQKIISGRLPDESLTASLDPVTGICMIDYEKAPICYV
ncbi:MAG: hypothetical protein KZQ93_15760 [Candidatus Thiodiazotropha sp. (ex Monitilora ramsayi)]|nr:hypothetical protein [Candidatus Thiodiazotropha sp. (ex Monitilora ramsayi)]